MDHLEIYQAVFEWKERTNNSMTISLLEVAYEALSCALDSEAGQPVLFEDLNIAYEDIEDLEESEAE